MKKFALILHSLNPKYNERRLESAPKILPILQKCDYQYRYVVGGGVNDAIYDDGVFLHIPLEEIYENIPLKLIVAYKWIIEKYNPDYILKCDDDTVICNESVFIEEEKQAMLLSNVDYIMVNPTQYVGNKINYHIDLVSNIIYKKDLYYPPVLYSGGPMYYLSNKAINDLSIDDAYYTIFEDMNMGHSCQKYNWSSLDVCWKLRGIVNWGK